MIDPAAFASYRSYRVPRQHAKALIDPPVDRWPTTMRNNVQSFAEPGHLRIDVPWTRLRELARSELVSQAIEYTSTYRDYSSSVDAARPIVMSGHQPDLFHAGVWFKNFALSKIGTVADATAINLIVDNDICQSRSVRVPTVEANRVRVAQVAFDDPADAVPYEQATVNDWERFCRFADRVADTVRPLSPTPLITSMWPVVLEAYRRCGNLGLAFAQARHHLESQLGLQTMEVPISQICRQRTFYVFLLELLEDLPQLHECYNRAVQEYRTAHRIRSRSHPVPELRTHHQHFELPLWMYDDQHPKRRPLFVQAHDDRFEFTDLGRTVYSVNRRNGSIASAEEWLETTNVRGIKIRPRALVTTMYARLVLSDLFLHGIGGGKYDQLNDRFIQRFFGITPPQFAVLSATYAPLSGPDAAKVRDSDEIRQEIRSTHFHPERWQRAANIPTSLLDQKRELLDSIPPRGSKKGWHEQMTAVNQRMAASLEGVRDELRTRWQSATAQESQTRLLGSREYPFCIYPLSDLSAVLSELLE